MWFCYGRMRLTGSRHDAPIAINLYTCNPAPIPSDSFDDADITLGATCQRCECRLIIRAVMHFVGRHDAVKLDDNKFRLPVLISL